MSLEPGDARRVRVERAPVRGIIVAVTDAFVIGLGGRVPWHYPADLRRFREVTWGSTVIMGRATWESIGSKPLSGRRNLVVSGRALPGVESFRSPEAALAAAATDAVWFIGGARVYAAALGLASLLDMTIVPDSITDESVVRFPSIDPREWIKGPLEDFPGDHRLRLRRYRRASSP